MSKENEAVISALTALFQRVEQGIQEARKALEAIAPQPQEPQLVQQQAGQLQQENEKIRKMFPDEWIERLTFTMEGKVLKVKPNSYLGSKLFSELAGIIKSLQGKYVSAGKDSHFEILME